MLQEELDEPINVGYVPRMMKQGWLGLSVNPFLLGFTISQE